MYPEPSPHVKTQKETDPNPYPHRTYILMEEAENTQDNKRVQEIMCWGVKSRRESSEKGHGDFLWVKAEILVWQPQGAPKKML